MIDPIKRKPISKPKPYKDPRGKYKWVVYYHDPKKDVRAKKLFVEKFSADEFYSTQSLIENKLGAEANNISFEDRKDILVKPMKVKARNGKITLKLNGEVNYVVVK